MRGARKILAILILAFLNLLIGSQVVFASSDLSITLSPNNLELNARPEQFTTATQTITASTTSEKGYTIKMRAPKTTSSLVNTSDSSLTIPTFILPSGSSSLPADSTGYGYGFSIDNGQNYYPIPEPSSLPFELFSTSESGQNTHSLTYGVLASSSDLSGAYENTITIYITANLAPCPGGNICYYGNGDDDTGTMDNQPASSNSDVMLIAPNFSRPGYGFAGWSTVEDGDSTNTYGPNQTIHTGDLSTLGLQLYARWVESSGTLQGWKGCSSLAPNEIVALTDERDGNTYAITKHADDQCWMMENLRLDLSDPDLEINGSNTNRPTSSFMHAINATPRLQPTNDFCTGTGASCVNRILFNNNNTDRTLTASYDNNDNKSSWYSYGNYYNWYTATAANGTHSLDTSGSGANGDLCPANWRLPAGVLNYGDYSILDKAMGGTGGDQETVSASNRWRNYPLNFIVGGEQKGNTAANRDISSSYATLNASTAERTLNLWLKTDAVYAGGNTTNKHRGQTIRCLFNEGYHINGNIHYDANGGTGTMPDEIDVNFGTALAANNAFTRTGYIFTGWNSSPDGKGVVITEGGMVAGAADREGLTEGDTLILYAIWQPSYSLVYAGNGADAGSMSSVNVSNLNTGPLALITSNFSRDGYGFAGWSFDPDAGTKLINKTSVKIYGPNEKITVDNAFLKNADPSTFVITLYAVWVPQDTTYTMQTFTASECSTLNKGETLALRDTRDDNVYTVTKLADENCWMTENLRLKPNLATFDGANTNNPTADFITAASSSSSLNTMCATFDSTCIDTVAFNSNAINDELPAAHNVNNNNSSWYSYGVMYNWYTATAGNGTYDSTSGQVTGDICPAGWRLPTGGPSGEYKALNTLISGSAATDSEILKFPANFIYSGDFNTNLPGGRNTYGRFWTATPSTNNDSYRFGYNGGSNVTPANVWYKWTAFAVRCIVNK